MFIGCPNLTLTNVSVGVDVICFTINYAAQTSFNISYGTPNSQAMMLSYIVDTTVLLTELSPTGQYMITVAPNDCPQTVDTTLTTGNPIVLMKATKLLKKIKF